jgi:GDP-L-fucose synthase
MSDIKNQIIMKINKSSKIFISGHLGMVGSACWRILEKNGYKNLIGKSSKELDLRNQNDVKFFFNSEKPQVVINAAAVVGGIMANNIYPYKFLMDNMLMQNNLIQMSLENDVEKFIFLGSSCIYPKFSEQPIREKSLLSGYLEPTNEPYAVAKISSVKLCEYIKKQFSKDFISLLPTNLFGPNDNFDLETSHVLPALIRKFHDAKINNSNVNLWGSGSPLREFLHVDDLASAVLFSIENVLPDSFYNIGYGKDIRIDELAKLVQNIVKHKGLIYWDHLKPDGTPKKLLDSSKFNSLGWNPKITLETGISETYSWFLDNLGEYKSKNFE